MEFAPVPPGPDDTDMDTGEASLLLFFDDKLISEAFSFFCDFDKLLLSLSPVGVLVLVLVDLDPDLLSLGSFTPEDPDDTDFGDELSFTFSSEHEDELRPSAPFDLDKVDDVCSEGEESGDSVVSEDDDEDELGDVDVDVEDETATGAESDVSLLLLVLSPLDWVTEVESPPCK